MRYYNGTRIQRRDGHIFVKTGEYGLIKEARLIAILGGADLGPMHRVFFRDGDRENTKPGNITWVRFNETRFKFLPSSRVIFLPKEARRKKVIAKKLVAA